MSNQSKPTTRPFPCVHAFKVAPLASSGIEKLECDNLKLQCFQSRTGVKFVLTAEPGTPDLDNVLHGIYELYADYVLKVVLG